MKTLAILFLGLAITFAVPQKDQPPGRKFICQRILFEIQHFVISVAEPMLPFFEVKETSRSGNEMAIGITFPDGSKDNIILLRHYKYVK